MRLRKRTIPCYLILGNHQGFIKKLFREANVLPLFPESNFRFWELGNISFAEPLHTISPDIAVEELRDVFKHSRRSHAFKGGIFAIDSEKEEDLEHIEKITWASFFPLYAVMVTTNMTSNKTLSVSFQREESADVASIQESLESFIESLVILRDQTEIKIVDRFHWELHFYKLLRKVHALKELIMRSSRSEMFLWEGIYLLDVATHSSASNDFLARLIKSAPSFPPRLWRQRKGYRLVKKQSIAISALALTAAIILQFHSFGENVALLDEVEGKVYQFKLVYENDRLPVTEKAEVLDRVYQYYQHLKNHKQSWIKRLSFQFDDTHRMASHFPSIIHTSMKSLFRDPTQYNLEIQLRDFNRAWKITDDRPRGTLSAEHYRAMLAYFFLNAEMDFLPDYMVSYLSEYWAKAIGASEDSNRFREGEVSLYLKLNQPDKKLLDSNLFIASKEHLLDLNAIADNTYFLLKEDELNSTNAFSRKAWRNKTKEIFNQRLEDAVKILSLLEYSQDDDRLILENKMKRAYADDYSEVWLQKMKGAEAKGFHDLRDASYHLNLLSSLKGPIKKTLLDLSDNIGLLKDEFSVSFVDEIAFLQGDALDVYLKQLKSIQQELDNLALSLDPNEQALQSARRLFSGEGDGSSIYQSIEIIHDLLKEVHDPHWHHALEEFLLMPVKASWDVVLEMAGQKLNDTWEGQVYAGYDEAIRGKFPFDRKGEATDMDSVRAFLDPKKGVMPLYLQKELMPFLEQDAKGNWASRQWLGAGVSFSPNFLDALSHGERVGHALFHNTKHAVGFNFSIYPEPNPYFSEILFDFNGEDYRYENGPQEWITLHWPGGQRSDESFIQAYGIKGYIQSELEYHDDWGLFHLCYDGQLKRIGHRLYRTRWHFNSGGGEDSSVSLLIRTHDYFNVFDEILLSQFELPRKILLEV